MAKTYGFLVLPRTRAPGWSKLWPTRVKDARAILLLARSFPELAAQQSGTVEIEFTDDRHIQSLNLAFRSKDMPTNVLAFADSKLPFGAIVLSLETIKDEAKAQQKNFMNHAKHMLVHGFLHLCGYDHLEPKPRRLMESLETRMLAAQGIPNPYLPTRI